MSELSVLLERETVTAATSELLACAAQEEGRALFLVGGAGLGKTAIVDQARRAAADRRFGVNLGQGDAAATDLPFGLFSQVVEPLSGRALFERAHRFHAALSWAERAGRPLLLALDDLHWADADSLALLSFLCRRARRLPVAILGTMRPWPTCAHDLAAALTHDGLAKLQRLAPLSEAAAATLLAAGNAHRVEPARAARAWRLCAGNPLLLTRLAEAIRHGQAVPEQVELTLPLARFAGVPEVVFRYAQVASVLGPRFRPDVAAEIAALDEGELQLALEALHRGGLVEPVAGGTPPPVSDPDRVGFVQPLFRQALHDDLPPAERSRLHRLAFRVALRRGTDPAEVAVHAMAGRMHGDQEAIEALDQAGQAAARAGVVAAATTHFRVAVELAGETAGPALLIRLGEIELGAGNPSPAATLFRRLLSRDDLDVGIRVDVLRKLGAAQVANHEHAQGEARLLEAASLAERAGDRARVVQALLDHAQSWMPPPRRVLPSAQRAYKLATGLDQGLRVQATIHRAFLLLLSGDPSGVDEAHAAAAFVEQHPEKDPGWRMSILGTYHRIANFIERFDVCERMHRLAVAAAERTGAAGLLSAASIIHCDTLLRLGRLEEALALGQQAPDAPELVAPFRAPTVGIALAVVLQFMGRSNESEAWSQRAHQRLVTRQSPQAFWLWHLRGLRWLDQGHAEQASDTYRHLEELVRGFGLEEPCAVPWSRDAIRAHVAAGRVEDACRVLNRVERDTARLPCRWPRIVAHTAHATLAERAGDVPTAEAHFQRALEFHGQVQLPLERARTLIDYGAFLRRGARQPAAARRPLAEALVLAERAGAVRLAVEAQGELRLAGGRRRRPGEPATLTPREARVAELAANRRTNLEIARQLVISTKTVETHLRHVFGKLAVTSRRDLPAALERTAGPAPKIRDEP
jgi:DNA-binding CsgD family transcriptional regulator